ncbi:alpha/beta fold hydrolase [Rhodoferax saidenbachensis]|nr:alpha/beta hydrolase [Rhodoferax saidenbachensis]
MPISKSAVPMTINRRNAIFLGAAMFVRSAYGETSSDAIWHNKIPPLLSEPAVDIDKDPNLLHKYADNAGTKIHYVTMGSNKNPLMVFVHGFPDFWYSWRNQIQTFSKDYQVVAVDLRGYNMSGRPEGVDNYKFAVLLDDIRAVISAESNGRKAILVGHDWGAALSWLFTGQNPDLVEKLVVLSVPHPGAIKKEFLPWNHPLAQLDASAYATRFLAQGKGDNLTPQDLAYWVLDPRAKSRYIEAFTKSSLTSLMNYYKANYALSQVALSFFDSSMKKIYSAPIKCPVLHLHGSEEHHALVSTMELEKSWMESPGNLTVKIIPGVGHFIQHEVPDYLDKTIAAWLKT